MAFLNKVYTSQSHENFDAWLKSVGLPDDKVAVITNETTTIKFEKNGDSYIVTQTHPQGSKTTTFVSGVELDDTIGADNVPVKTTYTVNGNTIIQVLKTLKGFATFKRVFNGDDLILEITDESFDGVAKRYFKAL